MYVVEIIMLEPSPVALFRMREGLKSLYMAEQLFEGILEKPPVALCAIGLYTEDPQGKPKLTRWRAKVMPAHREASHLVGLLGLDQGSHIPWRDKGHGLFKTCAENVSGWDKYDPPLEAEDYFNPLYGHVNGPSGEIAAGRVYRKKPAPKEEQAV